MWFCRDLIGFYSDLWGLYGDFMGFYGQFFSVVLQEFHGKNRGIFQGISPANLWWNMESRVINKPQTAV